MHAYGLNQPMPVNLRKVHASRFNGQDFGTEMVGNGGFCMKKRVRKGFIKKMLQKAEKRCNIYQRIMSYIISGEGKGGFLSN
jgi:hypothetical protein